ncbi:acetyl-CoA carboxylase biotin carboxylase subunit family protein [Pseudomonas sp. 18058]|uniref:ATP-grasp domain-containing protein n=1 Tax=Pseudomonas sp. 18058 TaxID=2681406 RepID=UPI00135C9741|nr:ATP-grasp domain-containing protein [Pseudomonas sp. 18058]
MRQILIVGINKVSIKYVCEAIRSAGFEPILSVDPAGFHGAAKAVFDGVTCIPAFSDTDALSAYLQANKELVSAIHSITTFFDELFPMVSAVAKAFGFNAPPAEFAKLSSKEFVGGLIPEHVPAETCVLLNDGDFEISWLTPGIKNDVVLKPSVGSGAVATMLLTIAANEDPSSVIKSAILGSGIDQPESTAWIVQAHCEGDLVSMEGFAQDGQVVFLGLSKRNRVGFTEVANQFPANEMIGLTVRSKIETAVCDLIARAEFDNGFFHCEFIATPSTAYLIDANMGRLGGASIVEQIALAYDLAPATVLQHVALLPLGLLESTLHYKPVEQCRQTLSYWYCLDQEAIVHDWEIPLLSSIHTPIANVGSLIVPIGTSDYAWVGMLTGYADVVVREIGQVLIHTDRGTRRPVFQ